MDFDIMVLGSGPGGYVTAIRASQLGFKTAVVEKENLGGVCLNWGCIPTKSLLKSAQVFEYLKHAEDYGIKAEKYSASFDGVVKRSRNVADGMSKGVQFLMKKNQITVINGYGKLIKGKKVEVKNEKETKTYAAKHIIIATGARSRTLESIPQDGRNVIGYREALTLKKMPKSLIVIGSGAIGTEFAYFYNSMGAEVTIIEAMDQVVPLEDLEIAKELTRNFKKNKIKIHDKTTVKSVEVKDGKCLVNIEKNGKEETLEAEKVLSAVGVQANIENIGLETLNIKMEREKIVVDGYYKTNVEGIYAIGDVINTQALAHVASAEGITCVENIAGLNPEKIDYENIPSCTYCSPEIASVGLTEKQALDKGYKLKVGKFPFSASGKASAAGHKEGFVKLIFDDIYGEILGAHMIGANVTEMIAEIVALRKLESTGHEIIKTVHPHPTLSEAIMEAAAAAYGEAIHI